MKIYRNKLYCIPDAAKRGGVTEDQIKEMITYHVIMAPKQFGIPFVLGGDIPELEREWADWEAKKKKMGQAFIKKDPIKNTKVTMLKMKEGD